MATQLSRMKQLTGTTAEWTTNNLVLQNGEVGIEVVSGGERRMKVGDGTRTFSALPYLSGGAGGAVTFPDIAKSFTSTAVEKRIAWNPAENPGSAQSGPDSSIFLQRAADYTGGTAGKVSSALYIQTFTPVRHANFEWGLTSEVFSSSVEQGGGGAASVPQNCAVNGTIWKLAGASAPVWGGNFVAYDIGGDYSAGHGPLIGVELNVGIHGVDSGQNTIGMHFAPQVSGGSGSPSALMWTALLIDGNSTANWRWGMTIRGGSEIGIRDEGNHTVGIDLQGTYGQAAIRLKSGSDIAFEETGFIKMRYNAGLIEFWNGSNRRGYINVASGADVDLGASGGGSVPANVAVLNSPQTFTAHQTFSGGIETQGIVSNSGMSLGASGTIQWNGNMASQTARAGSTAVPATASGFITIYIDGNPWKIPFYGA